VGGAEGRCVVGGAEGRCVVGGAEGRYVVCTDTSNGGLVRNVQVQPFAAHLSKIIIQVVGL
jgi:hypothetical protein